MKWLAHLLVISTLLTGTAFAAGPSSPFAAVGVVNSIDAKRNFIIVSDSTYQLTHTTRVFATNGSTMSVSDLKKGTRVGIVLLSQNAGRNPIAGEIHMLPINYRSLGAPPVSR